MLVTMFVALFSLVIGLLSILGLRETDLYGLCWSGLVVSAIFFIRALVDLVVYLVDLWKKFDRRVERLARGIPPSEEDD